MLLGTASLLAGLLYLNALDNPFVYDDYHTVVDNPSLHDLTEIRTIVLHALTRPIVNFSYAVDFAAWGPRPFGFHLTNVLLHMLNVGLLFHLAWRTSGRPWIAFLSSGLFGVHPMMTEAVGYISGRSEVLCATFFLLGMLSGRRWILGGGMLPGALTAVLWLAMLLTKEIGAMFPFVLAAYDRLLITGEPAAFRRRMRTTYLPVIGFAILAGVARLLVLARVEYPGQVWVHWPYVLLALDVIRRYIGLMLYPATQTIFHAVNPVESIFAWRVVLAAATLGGLATLAWWRRTSDGLVTLGILWFVLLLVPSAVLTIVDQGEPMAEHRVYAASCGLFLAIGAGAGAVAQSWSAAGPVARRLAAAGVAVVLAALSVQTVLRNRVWSDPIKLWGESVAIAPQHYRPRLLLGESLQAAGRRSEAAAEFETAIRLRPDDVTGHLKLGETLVQMGEVQAAREEFAEALRLDPKSLPARQYLHLIDDLQLRVEKP